MNDQLIVIFGGTGDLAQKKLLPALRKLYSQEIDQPVLLVGRSNSDIHEYIQDMGIEDYEDSFLENLYYLSLDVKTGDPEDLRDKVESVSNKHGIDTSYTFYLALPYFLFTYTSSLIQNAGLNTDDSKIAFEKPFGKNLETAQRINQGIDGFKEQQIFRVDHYLGKELVENIVTLRFSNPLFQKIWDAESVKNVQITMAEDMGVNGRTGYYEEAGAIKDVFQNHLLQVLSLTAMDQPDSLTSEDIRDRKLEVLEKIQDIESEDIVLGQYGSKETDKDSIKGYRQLDGVRQDSDTETFFALKLHLDMDNWRDTPFYVRSGKMMDEKYAEVNVVLEDDTDLFDSEESSENVVNIRIQPDSGISVRFNSKGSGGIEDLEAETMEACKACRQLLPGAYEHILEELLEGDRTMFVDWEVLEQSWRITDSVVETAEHQETEFPNYTPGSEGPEGAEDLIDDGSWIKLNRRSNLQ